MADNTDRKAITLAKVSFRYMERLAEKGTHGSDWVGVARGFIEAGIRDAIERGYLKIEDGDEK